MLPELYYLQQNKNLKNCSFASRGSEKETSVTVFRTRTLTFCIMTKQTKCCRSIIFNFSNVQLISGKTFQTRFYSLTNNIKLLDYQDKKLKSQPNSPTNYRTNRISFKPYPDSPKSIAGLLKYDLFFASLVLQYEGSSGCVWVFFWRVLQILCFCGTRGCKTKDQLNLLHRTIG